MEELSSSEKSVLTRAIRRNIPEESIISIPLSPRDGQSLSSECIMLVTEDHMTRRHISRHRSVENHCQIWRLWISIISPQSVLLGWWGQLTVERAKRTNAPYRSYWAVWSMLRAVYYHRNLGGDEKQDSHVKQQAVRWINMKQRVT
jgi:hypothetical protein